MQAITLLVLLVTLTLWLVVGFLFWIPLLVRAVGSFFFLVLYASLTNQEPAWIGKPLEEAIGFYPKGFRRIIDTLTTQRALEESGQPLHASHLRFLLELAYTVVFWILLLWSIGYSQWAPWPLTAFSTDGSFTTIGQDISQPIAGARIPFTISSMHTHFIIKAKIHGYYVVSSRQIDVHASSIVLRHGMNRVKKMPEKIESVYFFLDGDGWTRMKSVLERSESVKVEKVTKAGDDVFLGPHTFTIPVFGPTDLSERWLGFGIASSHQVQGESDSIVRSLSAAISYGGGRRRGTCYARSQRDIFWGQLQE